jgi:hypothetical protein
LHLEFTPNFSTIFVGSFNIRASREALPTEVRSPEIDDVADEKAMIKRGFIIWNHRIFLDHILDEPYGIMASGL